jgi:hypothetical protein
LVRSTNAFTSSTLLLSNAYSTPTKKSGTELREMFHIAKKGVATTKTSKKADTNQLFFSVFSLLCQLELTID